MTRTQLTAPVPHFGGVDALPLFRRVLVAVDFSPSSNVALAQARVLAEVSGADLVVLHVLEGFPRQTVYSAGRAAQLIGRFEGRVDALDRQLRALLPANAVDGRVEYVTASGVAGDAIVAAAAEHGADLVVLGASQGARLDRLVSGSTVKTVVRNAGCAVLVTPPPSD